MGGRGSGRRTAKVFVCALDRDEFDRQPGEPETAWKSFIVYRDMGLDRTLEKTRVVLGKTNPGYLKALEEWSREWAWRARVEAWDREIDRRHRKAMFAEVEKMRQRHVNLAVSLQGLGAVELQKLLDAAKKAIKTNVITGELLIKLIDLGVKLERQGRGEPESIIEERRQLTADEERDSMKALLRDPKAMEAVDRLIGLLHEQPGNKKSNK